MKRPTLAGHGCASFGNYFYNNKIYRARIPLFTFGVIFLLLWPVFAAADGVTPLFTTDVAASPPFKAPYPRDIDTVPDPSQITGLRLNFPKPNCQQAPDDCNDTDVINTLDGFNLQPLLVVPFSGPIDVNSVSSQTVFLIRVGDVLPSGDQHHKRIGINQIGWDVETNSLAVESDEFLDEHTRYALIVTREVRDTNGKKVKEAKEFKQFLEDDKERGRQPSTVNTYRKKLLNALEIAEDLGVKRSRVVVASVFTTQSATTTLEKIRDQIHAVTPDPADFRLGPNSLRTVFSLSDITTIVHTLQVGTDPVLAQSFQSFPLFLQLLEFSPGSISRIAFGKYRSPYYLAPGEFIPAVGTRSGTPQVQQTKELFFNLFVPSGPQPANGWPVAIVGHGSGVDKQHLSFFVASSLAAKGIASIAINAVGNGGGSLSTLTVLQRSGVPVTFPAGGRGFDQNGDGLIASQEGAFAAPPYAALGQRDGLQQTIVDLMQLVNVIRKGIDVDADGVPDLDPSRIYYTGQSLGGIYGSIFLGIEPHVRVGVLNVMGGSLLDVFRFNPVGRPLLGFALATRNPPLINVGGPSGIEFNENIPLRNQPPRINTVPGAFRLRVAFDASDLIAQAANPVAYAVHLRKRPLAGVPTKSVIIQFAFGDQFVQNPLTTAVVRAGDLADRTSFYRHDLAFADPLRNPTGAEVPPNAHFMLLFNPFFGPSVFDVAQNAKQQIAEFFASDGTTVIDPDGPGPLFETPIAGPLPEACTFVGPIPNIPACQ